MEAVRPPLAAPPLSDRIADYVRGDVLSGAPAYEFKTTPFEHQFKEWCYSREEAARAIFWEQGTGKSKLTIDTACWLWLRGLIDAVIVVAPNGVHRNWVTDEIPAHIPDGIMSSVRALYYQSQRADTKWHRQAVKAVTLHKGFAWLTISYEAFVTAGGKRALVDFFDRRRVLYVLDEGQNIKTHDTERTKSILRSAKYAPFRRILTGTPISQGPFDTYSEIRFLVDSYWSDRGFSTYTEFKTHFGVFKKVWNPNVTRKFDAKQKRWVQCSGAEVDVLDGYRRLDQLNAMLQPIMTRVTKSEVLDLLPKLYSKRYFTMTPEQAKLYKQLKDEFIVWLDLGGLEKEAELLGGRAPASGTCSTCDGKREITSEGFIYPCPDCGQGELFGNEGDTPVIASLAITRLLRLQQIACGYLPTDNEDEPLYVIPGPNRRLEILCDLVEQSQHKVIVWARFQLDITLILDALAARGIKAVRYDGLVSEDERAEAKALFQGQRPIIRNGQMLGREAIPEEEQAKVFVGNPAAGATGLTLTEAKTTIYYSNSFKLIDRLQSEDRNHRIGQTNQVLYVDIVAEDTVDERIVTSLRNKLNVASQILGDQLKEWI